MTTRTITTTQLRGMIKEALEESVQEIAVDEQIAALKAKGGRRSLQETKQYRKLLEFKMGGLTELSARRDEEGVNPDLLGLPITGSGRQERDALEGEEGNEYRVAVEKALDALKQARTVQSKLSQVDTRPEIMDFLTAMTRELMVGANPAVREMGGQALLRLVANNYKEETPSTLDESRRRFLRRR